jgi:ankyrin repeat protein
MSTSQPIVSNGIKKLIITGNCDRASYEKELNKLKKPKNPPVDINTIFIDDNGTMCSPFWLAILHDKIDCVRTLIEMGADVNKPLFIDRDRIEENTLNYALRLKRYEIAELLIESRPDTTITPYLHSPIYYTIDDNQLNLTRKLVDFGANINGIDHNRDYKELPLIHHAIYSGTLDMVKLLIELGANTQIKNSNGETPLMYATRLQKQDKSRFFIPKNIKQIIELFSEPHISITTEVDDKISVFNPISPFGEEEPASTFFDEQKEFDPFIIRVQMTKKNESDEEVVIYKYSGEAIGWPASSSSGKIFVECKDDSPVSWRGLSYGDLLKPNAREFIKMNVLGSICMVEKPEWYSSGVPGTKYFNLVKLPDKVYKFVSSVLASSRLPDGWDATGAEHCNQRLSNTEIIATIPSEVLITRFTPKEIMEKKTPDGIITRFTPEEMEKMTPEEIMAKLEEEEIMAKITPEEIKKVVSIGTYRLEEITLEELKGEEEIGIKRKRQSKDEGRGIRRKRQSVKKTKECRKRNPKTGRCISRKKNKSARKSIYNKLGDSY